MATTRREFVKTAAAGTMGAALAPAVLGAQASDVPAGDAYDVAVVGAGDFGAWTAYWLSKSGRRVALIDAYGPGNARASSGGQTRVIRMGYGDQEVYTRWSSRSLEAVEDAPRARPAARPSSTRPASCGWRAATIL